MEHADVALRSCTPETTCYNRRHPREVLSTGTTRHLASPVHAPRGWGACASGPRSRSWGHRPLPSPNPAASKRCLLWTRLQSPPVRPAPRPVPADRVGICRSGFTAGRALQVAGDTAGYKRGIGTPSPGNKSERMSPWAAGSPERSRSAAHSSLGTWEGRVAHGPAGSPLPTSRHQGTSSGSGRGCLLAQTTEGRAAAYSASFPSPPPTHAVVFGQPLPSLCPMCHLQEAGY